jgi:NAD(P)-dependent dehydrogenase (short-subunit alcohol dehydrogenase family)
MSNVWFITGAARGIGADTARAAHDAGDRVVATGRNASHVVEALGRSDRLLILELDVTRPDDAVSAASAAIARFGRIDVLLNNAGYALLGALEECSAEEVETEFQTNVFGLLHVTRAVLPAMRAARRGHIINLSSLSGIRGDAGASAYCASKFAVEGISESLSKEVGPLGIKVTVVEPGYFRTDFLDPKSVRFSAAIIDDYDATAGATRRGVAAVNGLQANDPKKLAAVLVKLSREANPPFRFASSADAVEVAEVKMLQWRAELEQWRPLSESTGFDPS